jgi:acyl carrier protein
MRRFRGTGGDEVADTIRRYILDILGDKAPSRLGDDEPLLSSGLIDSLAVEQLLYFVEDKYEIELDERDLSAANFETIGAMAAFVREKLGEEIDEAAAGEEA